MNASPIATLTREQVAAFRASANASGSEDLAWLADQLEAGDARAAALVREAVDAAADALRNLEAKAAAYRQVQPLQKLLATD